MSVMPHFDYHRPASIHEALELLGRLGPDARLIAGGTDLVPQMRAGRAAPRHLVSVNDIEGLDRLAYSDGTGLVSGGGVRINAVGRHPAVRARYPGLVRACSVMATNVIRNMATVAGNLVNGSPCADTSAPLLVCDAKIDLASHAGRRVLPLTELHRGPGVVNVSPDEIVEVGAGTGPGIKEVVTESNEELWNLTTGVGLRPQRWNKAE